MKILVENAKDFAQDTKVLPAEEPDSLVRVDFIFSFTPYEAQAIRNGRQVSVEDYPVKFASCEDLIIHKMVAGRAIDEEDVAGILVRNRGEIDCRYIEKWLLEFDRIAEHKGVASRFNSLLRKHYE